MKKTMLIIGIILFSLNSNSQKKTTKLYLTNGDTIQGLAKITAFGKIKFRYNKKSKKKIYLPNQLIKFDLNEHDSKNTYAYKYIQGNQRSTKRKLMILITAGKIDLYRITTTTTSAPMAGSFGGMGGMVMSFTMDSYYVSRDDSDMVTKLTSRGTLFEKNFKKAASEYFKDCKSLVNKIQNKTYKKRDIEEIVEYYNTQCN
jgi:hypothetical protein